MSVLIKSKLTGDAVSFILPVETYPEEDEASKNIIEVEDTAKLEDGVAALEPVDENLSEVSHDDTLQDELPSAEEQIATYNEEELEALKQTAKEEGYRTGYQEAVDDVKAQYDSKLEALDTIANSLNESTNQHLQQSEVVIAAIVFTAVRQIIGEALVNEAQSLAVVKEALGSLNHEQISEVLVSQSDFDLIQALKGEFLAPNQNESTSFDELNIKADDSIALGGCKVKLLDGYLDATIKNQLDMLAKMLVKKADDMESKYDLA